MKPTASGHHCQRARHFVRPTDVPDPTSAAKHAGRRERARQARLAAALPDLPEGFSDVPHLVICEFGEHRHAEHLSGQQLGVAQVHSGAAQVRVAEVPVHGSGIVDQGTTPRAANSAWTRSRWGAQTTYRWNACERSGKPGKRPHGRVLQRRVVDRGDLAAAGGPGAQARQLGAENRRLDLVQTTVDPSLDVLVSPAWPYWRTRRNRSARVSSEVTTAPPSPAAPRFFVG